MVNQERLSNNNILAKFYLLNILALMSENIAVWDMRRMADTIVLFLKAKAKIQKMEYTDGTSRTCCYPFHFLVYTIWCGTETVSNGLENYAVVSYQGLAPYWFEMENSLRINEDGDMQFINETEYDWQLSQVSYLQPRLEVVANLTDSEKYDRQSGLSNIRIGLRYRHEIVREVAPYVGVYYSKALGNTADALKAEGKSTSETGVVLGQVWFKRPTLKMKTVCYCSYFFHIFNLFCKA